MSREAKLKQLQDSEASEYVDTPLTLTRIESGRAVFNTTYASGNNLSITAWERDPRYFTCGVNETIRSLVCLGLYVQVRSWGTLMVDTEG